MGEASSGRARSWPATTSFSRDPNSPRISAGTVQLVPARVIAVARLGGDDVHARSATAALSGVHEMPTRAAHWRSGPAQRWDHAFTAPCAAHVEGDLQIRTGH